jgi:hypothetical protein
MSSSSSVSTIRDNINRRNKNGLFSRHRLDGGTIHLPSREKDRPDRDRLALRFERFKAVA